MKRIMLLIVTVFLFAPSLLCGYLWWRSTTQTDDIYQYSLGRMTRYRSSGGGFWFETRPWEASTPAKLDWQVYTDRALYPFTAGPDDPWYERWGILWNTRDYDFLIAAPYSLVLILNLPIPLWWLWRQATRPVSQAPPPAST